MDCGYCRNPFAAQQSANLFATQPLNIQVLIQTGLNNFNCIQQLSQSFQSKIFTLHRDDYAVGGCGQSVDG